jgi:hypothetical protein
MFDAELKHNFCPSETIDWADYIHPGAKVILLNRPDVDNGENQRIFVSSLSPPLDVS